jgi:uncharacterized protein YjiK
VTAHYDVSGKAGTCAGLAIDAKNRVLFVACREPHVMVILNAEDGNIITTPPLSGVTRRRRVESRYDGSIQLARRRHVDRD